MEKPFGQAALVIALCVARSSVLLAGLMLPAYMASVSDLTFSILALRFVAVGIPPIFLMDRLAFLILLVSVGAITLFRHVNLSSQVSAMRDHRNLGVLE